MKKRLISLILIMALLFTFTVGVFASDQEVIDENDIYNGADDTYTSGDNITLNAKSAILMDAETGAVLYAKNAHEALPPASVTKIMTLLLVAEAIADGRITLDQKVTVSANASGMGGSQIFIKEGEIFTVEELLKSAVIASANDAAVALAELISGSESAFVSRMNERARELSMKNTVFENATGLDDTVTKHQTSAYDIAVMSRELIKHDVILKHSNVWQDSIRNGEFILTNTNRLVRYYSGCTGLKTGSTDKAGFCVSATAKRDGMHLIAEVMGSPTRDERNNSARSLLDYGFANYALYRDSECDLEQIPVKRGTVSSVMAYSTEFSLLISRSDIKRIEKKYTIPESVIAPFEKNSKIGEIIYYLDDNELGRSDICVREGAERISFIKIVSGILWAIIVGKGE